MIEKVSVRVVAQMTSFKQAVISTLFEIPKQKPDMEEVDDVSPDIIIRDTYVIKTVEQTSNEGKRLSGYKQMIQGDLQFTLEYTADSKSQQCILFTLKCHLQTSLFYHLIMQRQIRWYFLLQKY